MACAVIAMIGVRRPRSPRAADRARSPRSRPSPASGSPSGRRRSASAPSALDRLAAVRRRRRRGSRAARACATRHPLVDRVVLGDQDARPRRAPARPAPRPRDRRRRRRLGGAPCPARRGQAVEQLRAAAPAWSASAVEAGSARRGRPRRRPSDVSSTSRAAPRRASAWIARASSTPSIPGICMSRSASVERRRPSAAARSSASSALGAVAGVRRRACPTPRAACAQDHAVGRVVVDDQHAQRRRSGRAGARRPRRRAGARSGAVNQNVLPCAGRALDADLAAHQLDELLRDGQAEPGAAVAARGRAVGLGERLEQPRRCASGAMPMPVSRDLEAHAARARRCRSSTRAATTTSPRSVNLTALPTRLISTWRSRPGSPRSAAGTSRRDAGDELEALRVRLLGEQLDDVLDDRRAGRSRRDSSCELAGLDLREVEDVVDDRRAARRRESLDRLDVLALLGVELACRAAGRSCRSRRSSACGSRGSCWPGTPTSGGPTRAPRRARGRPRPPSPCAR